MIRAALPALALPVLLAISWGCSGDDGGRSVVPCGASCDGDCTSTGECVEAGTAFDLRVRWTVDGVAPTPEAPAACAGIDHLRVSLVDDTIGDGVIFDPVPCDLGQITFLDLPPRLTRLTVEALDLAGALVAFADSNLPATMVLVDLH